jgi:hypothetical protein
MLAQGLRNMIYYLYLTLPKHLSLGMKLLYWCFTINDTIRFIIRNFNCSNMVTVVWPIAFCY